MGNNSTEKEKINALPPSSNTGVENTVKSGLIPCLDWLQATLKSVNSLRKIPELLGLNLTDFQGLKGGKYGYKQGIAFHGNPVLAIYYDGAENMGFHIEMTGQGCRLWENASCLTWSGLFQMLLVDYKAKITRLDVAIDDFDGYFKIPALVRKLKKNECTSRFRKAKHIENIIINGGETKGHTLYFGASTSDVQVRFYEKNVQMEVDVDVWNRTELQLRDERAILCADMIREDKYPLGQMISGLLVNYIQFRVPNPKDPDNKPRWKIAPFWRNFTQDAERLSIAKSFPKTSIEKKYFWIDEQVSKSFFMVYYSLSDQEKGVFLDDVLRTGSYNLTKADLQIINTYREKKTTYEQLKKVHQLLIN